MNIQQIAEEKAEIEYPQYLGDKDISNTYKRKDFIKGFQSCFTHLAGSGEGAKALKDKIFDGDNHGKIIELIQEHTAAHAAHLYKELEDKDREIANLKESNAILIETMKILKTQKNKH